MMGLVSFMPFCFDLLYLKVTNISMLNYLLFILITLSLTSASTLRTFYFNATWITANPDGVHEKQVISFNGSWPLPTIEVLKGDRVQVYLTNGLGDDTTTSLHFHGIFQNGTVNMDGPVGVTQCPIPPGETVLYDFLADQVGTYWYHSHSGSQYSDGLRGVFIIHDTKTEKNYKFDEELIFSISDWYHDSSKILVNKQLTRYNPTGAEPVPQNSLFNDSKNVTVHVEPEKTYLIRIVNIGIMVSQYIFFEDHDFEIIEVDGVYTQPAKAKTIYLTVGQRVSILLKTRSRSEINENFCIVQRLDSSMLDVVPPDLELTSINYLSYDSSLPNSKPKNEWYDEGSYEPFDDFDLEPFDLQPLLPEPDHRIELLLYMENLGDGVNYAFFNNHTYVSPKIPTLLSVLSSPSKYANDIRIYGSNTNSFILNKNEVVEIVINNEDDNKHPMHLHGHQFQMVARSEDFEEPVHFDPSKHYDFPKTPIRRDTSYVNGNGYMVLRFVADNPGVWFFHCHLDFHLEQGLAATFIEAPLELQKIITLESLPEDQLRICRLQNIPVKGNAAGISDNWFNLKGENKQPKPLPLGFTLKGYVALAICTLVALWGLKSIHDFGMKDVLQTEEDKIQEEKIVINELLQKLTVEQSKSPSNSFKSRVLTGMVKDLQDLNNKFSNI